MNSVSDLTVFGTISIFSERIAAEQRYRMWFTTNCRFGPLGTGLNSIMVRHQLKDIFDYREAQLKALFPE